MIYAFRVGVSPIILVATHSCLLIDRDLFEYGVPDVPGQAYRRLKDVGRTGGFDWDYVGEALHGTTRVSPDELEQAIINSGEWGPNKYNVLTHNCQDFVHFCLNALGCPSSMISKSWACYNRYHLKTFPGQVLNDLPRILSNSSKGLLAGFFPIPENEKNQLAKIIMQINQQRVSQPQANRKSIDEIAREVIRGNWGNGQDRKNRLQNAGYNPQEVQNRVNQLLKK